MAYLFCERIDRHICFNRDYISNCTIGNNTKGQMIPVLCSNYNGTEIDWEKFFKERENIKEQAKQGKLPDVCEGCLYLENAEWDYKNTKQEFKYIQLSHWLACNSNCIYCGNHSEPNKKGETDTYDSYPIIKDMIDKGYITRKTKIDFAGGEPTQYYRFEDILNLLNKSSVTNVVIHSNIINYSKAIETGIKRGTVSLCVSVDAGTKNTHEKVKGVKSFDKVWKHIKKYTKVKNPINNNYVSLKFIIVPGINDTKEEIDEFIKRAINAKVDRLLINADNNIFIQQKNEKERQEILKKVVEIADHFIERVREYNISYLIEFNVNSAYKLCNLVVPFEE